MPDRPGDAALDHGGDHHRDDQQDAHVLRGRLTLRVERARAEGDIDPDRRLAQELRHPSTVTARGGSPKESRDPTCGGPKGPCTRRTRRGGGGSCAGAPGGSKRKPYGAVPLPMWSTITPTRLPIFDATPLATN